MSLELFYVLALSGLYVAILASIPACLAGTAVVMVCLDRVTLPFRTFLFAIAFAMPSALLYLSTPGGRNTQLLIALCYTLQLWHAFALFASGFIGRVFIFRAERLSLAHVLGATTAIGVILGMTKLVINYGNMQDAFVIGSVIVVGVVYALSPAVCLWLRNRTTPLDSFHFVVGPIVIVSMIIFPLFILFCTGFSQIPFLYYFLNTARRLGWVSEASRVTLHDR